MPGRIRQSDIDEVKARTNIADVVGDYVTLKSAGVGSMKGLCPFHDERSPSFHVRPGVGYYHCFGCGESGDAFSFLQKMDGVTFAEAVERLAAKVGIELRYEDGAGPGSDHGTRARLLAANSAAAEFFVEQLTASEAQIGRQFLGERGFDPASAQQFGVGFAPKSWDQLTSHLRGRGFTVDELAAAGLVSRGDRGVYDRFRGRLVWPIRDVTGQTVGFGARRLLDDDQGPKYLNTAETPVYHKSSVLYGLDLAKRDISRQHKVVVVEGYTDVMACHLAGITTAVATCGTSFGVEHIKVLRRILGDDSGAGEVIFTFDPDAAGQKAATRAFAEERRFAAQTYVAVGPEGLDPCDLRLQRGDQAVRAMIDAKKPMFEFMLRQILQQYNLETVEGRVSALRAASPVVADIRDRAVRPGYERELARMLGMDTVDVSRSVSAAPRASAASASVPAGSVPAGSAQRGSAQGNSVQRGSAPGGSAQGNSVQRGSAPGGQRGDEGANRVPGRPVEAAAAYSTSTSTLAPPSEAPRDVPSLASLPNDVATRLERDALMAMLQYPAAVGTELIRQATACGFANASLAVVRDAVATTVEHAEEPGWLDTLAREVTSPYTGLVRELAVAPLPERSEREIEGYARGVTVGLIERDLLRRHADLLGRLQRADPTDREAYSTLQRQLVAVEARRRALREN